MFKSHLCCNLANNYTCSSFWRRPESRQDTCLALLQKVKLDKFKLAWIPAFAGMTSINIDVL